MTNDMDVEVLGDWWTAQWRSPPSFARSIRLSAPDGDPFLCSDFEAQFGNLDRLGWRLLNVAQGAMILRRFVPRMIVAEPHEASAQNQGCEHRDRHAMRGAIMRMHDQAEFETKSRHCLASYHAQEATPKMDLPTRASCRAKWFLDAIFSGVLDLLGCSSQPPRA